MSAVKKSLFGSLLLVSESITKKLIGLVSTLILARVLVPEDFGLVAIATLTLGFLDVLANTGSKQYLLRIDKIDSDIINTSWTIDFILRAIMAILLFAFTPLLAEYYDDERLEMILYVMASLIIVGQIRNPGLIYLIRQQNYAPTVKLSILTKFIAVGVAIAIALIYESYWALILGTYASVLMGSLGSFVIHPYRPKFCLKNAKEQWKFSSWLLPQSIIGFGRTQLDTIMVSAAADKSALGFYHIMKYIAFIPSSHLLLPATQPLLVQLAKTKHTKSHFSHQYNITFIATMLLTLPMTSLLFFYSELFVAVLLGEKWVNYAELFAAFSLLIPAFAILNQARRVLLVFGKTKHMFYYELVSFTVLYGTLFQIGISDLIRFSYIRVLMENGLCILFMLYITAQYTSAQNMLRLCLATAPIIVSCLISYLVTDLFPLTAIPLIDVALVTVIFSAVFCIVLTGLYYSFLKNIKEWQFIEGLVRKSVVFFYQKVVG
ncbi:MAG: lipopolysaccharide exporter [Psychromonas sp.]|jgi:lipopolysaccharide exporter|uniref:oligosaccharide flippase family protein n=1 Tax=Psychromonas sp. TaxID=1884585 RepID=UPI0039E28188